MSRVHNYLLNIDGYNELISLNKPQLEFIVEWYETIGKKYIGNTAGLQKEIEDLNKKIQSLHDEIKELKNHFILEKKDLHHIIELKDRDLIAKDKETEMNKKIYGLEIINRDLHIKLLQNK